MPILQEQKSASYRFVNSLAARTFALPAGKIPAHLPVKSLLFIESVRFGKTAYHGISAGPRAACAGTAPIEVIPAQAGTLIKYHALVRIPGGAGMPPVRIRQIPS